MSTDSRATDAAAHDAPRCDAAITAAFGILGKRWNAMILTTLGAGPVGFGTLRRAVGGISDTMLSDRLSELAAAGLVVREVDAGPPVAVGYRLTPGGEDLLPALEGVAAWSRRHMLPAGER